MRFCFLVLGFVFLNPAMDCWAQYETCQLIFPSQRSESSQFYVLQPSLRFSPLEVQHVIRRLLDSDLKQSLSLREGYFVGGHGPTLSLHFDLALSQQTTVNRSYLKPVFGRSDLGSYSESCLAEEIVHPQLLKKLLNILLSARSTVETIKERSVLDISFYLQVSSNSVGSPVRSNTTGDEKGFHTHSHFGDPDRMDFVMSLFGPGVAFEHKGQLQQGEEGQLILFEPDFPHGSPDAQAVRLIVVGSFHLQPQTLSRDNKGY